MFFLQYRCVWCTVCFPRFAARMKAKAWVAIMATALLPLGLSAADKASDPVEAAVKHPTDTLTIGVEVRSRYESRSGNGFGSQVDTVEDLVRTRLSMTWIPLPWLKISGMVQDARAPFYGPNAPNTIRDPADLHEAYVELFSNQKSGLLVSAGRRMLNYGDGRLIGTPQWSNLSRTYDHARVAWRLRRATVEFLLVSPVKVRVGEFNRPVLGDRMWGTYNVLPNLVRNHSMEFYLLRRDQNRPGGYTGTGRLEVNTFGARWSGPLAAGWKYTAEGALQNGSLGPADHRAGAWVANATRRFSVFPKPLDVTGEYKFASGNANPADKTAHSTFDQLYAANHDRFGHQDLFAWQNIHNLRLLASMPVRKGLTLNWMYDEFWLASAKDSLYANSGKSLAQSKTGVAGKHVGREFDMFGVWRIKNLSFGAGAGWFIEGGFVRQTTPGVNPLYMYVFESYSF